MAQRFVGGPFENAGRRYVNSKCVDCRISIVAPDSKYMTLTFRKFFFHFRKKISTSQEKNTQNFLSKKKTLMKVLSLMKALHLRNAIHFYYHHC